MIWTTYYAKLMYVTSWTIAHQAPLSMKFSSQEYWNGLPFPSPGDIPNKGIKPTSLMSPALSGVFFTSSTTWKAPLCIFFFLSISISKIFVFNLFIVSILCGEGNNNSLQYSRASLVAQLVKNPPAMRETWVWSLGWKDPLEKGKATYSSILAWRIPWTI